MADESTEQLDLEGRTVIPGFIDNHFHYLRGTNFAAYEMRIHGITSRRQVLDDISARAEALGPASGFSSSEHGTSSNSLTGRPLHAGRAGRGSAGKPVYIQRTYSAFYLNQLAADALYEVNLDWFADDGMIYVDIERDAR